MIERQIVSNAAPAGDLKLVEGDVVDSAKRAIVSYGIGAADVLELQALRLHKLGAVREALHWQRVADAASLILDENFSLH